MHTADEVLTGRKKRLVIFIASHTIYIIFGSSVVYWKGKLTQLIGRESVLVLRDPKFGHILFNP